MLSTEQKNFNSLLLRKDHKKINMMKKLKRIVNSEFANVDYDLASHSVIIIWKKTCTIEAYRLIFSELVGKISEYKINAFISDIYNQGIVASEIRLWLQNEILPKAYKKGLRKVATIAPHDVFSRFYIEGLKDTASKNFPDMEFEYFEDLVSARNWVKRVEIAA